ncbi:hypothetical protein OIU76_028611 [Salix suchowensis]|nr:hypothetical protein OIU76_028611 [Salix suchowensis]
MRLHHRHLLREMPLIYRGGRALAKRVKHRVARSKGREPQAVASEVSTTLSEGASKYDEKLLRKLCAALCNAPIGCDYS